MPYWTTDDSASIYYETHGVGRPIVFVSGWTMSSWHWQHQLDLAESYRVVTLDIRGHGRSGKQERDWTLGRAAQDLYGLINHLELSEVTLVGWSMGAFVLFEYIYRFGDHRLKALCSVEMTPRNTVDPEWEHGIFGDLDMAKVVAIGGEIIHRRAAWQRESTPAWFARGRELDEGTLTDWTSESMATPNGAALAFWLDLAVSDWRPLMPKLPIPTLLMHGSMSQACPTNVGEWMERTIPDARLVLFAHSGHAPFWEEPKKFNRELANFVNRP